MNSWQHAATVDPKTIRNWFNGLYRGHGVGLAMGTQPDGRHLFAVDLDVHNADGFDTLHELEQRYGKLPTTPTSITGATGAHVLFTAPYVVTNGAAGAVGPGIDIRGQGGQIVAAPSIHPNGRAYDWEDGSAPWDIPIAPAPEWLLELVRPPTPVDVLVPRSYTEPWPSTGDTPADILRQGWDWPTELSRAGWTGVRHDNSGDTHWTRPGKDPREGTSAVLHGADGPFVVFTTDGSVAPMWSAGTPTADGSGISLSPLAFYAATRHGGDLSAASSAIRGATPSVDLGSLIAPQTPVTGVDDDLRLLLLDWPTFWAKDHSEAEWIAEPIIPAKRSVALFAPGGAGKSLLALWLSAAIATGRPIFGTTNAPRSVLYLDYEMTEDDLHERLESMGYGAEHDLTRLHYALLPALPGLDEKEGGQAVVRLAELCGAELVVIDTFGRAVHGDENEADTVRAWYRYTGLHLKAAGRAFMRIDHAGKDVEKGQRGSSAKNDDVDVVWRLTVHDADVFKLTAKKRRMGWVPETVELARSDDDTLTYALTAGKGYPAGTAAVAARLDELGVPSTAGWRPAAEALRGVGEKHRTDVIRAAVKYRKAGGNDLANLAETGGVHPGVHPSATSSGPPAGPLGSKPSKPLVDAPGSTPGSTGVHLTDATGVQCGPLLGGPLAQRDPETPPQPERMPLL
jgi:hypothetical protein